MEDKKTDDFDVSRSSGNFEPIVPQKLVVASQKRPPPESAESIRIRSFVVFSFWAVAVFLGLPVWWWTTSIHRAHLPLRDMLDWADGKVWSST